MPIPQLSTSNTFGQWLTTTQALVERYNYVEDLSNNYIEVANGVVSFANIVNSAYDTANTVLEISQNAYDVANDAYDLAELALETSGTFFDTIFNIQDESSSSNTFYPILSASKAGVPEDVYVSSNKLSFVPQTGTLTTVVVNSVSDINKKKDIKTIQNALDTVLKLRGVSFKWKDNDYPSIGLIAQEVEEIIPELVSTDEFGEKSIAYSNIIGLLIESIKDIKEEINQLKNK
jgi:hypothetical protein